MLLEDEWETVAEVSQRLGYHESFIGACCRKGRLPARTWCSQWHIPRGAQLCDSSEALSAENGSFPYLSVAEVAATMGITVAEVCNRCRSGELKAERRSGWRSWHIPREAVKSV